MGLVSRGAEFLPFFAVANNGNTANRSDITFASTSSPGTPAPGAVAAKASADDDPNAYRTEVGGALEATPALAVRLDAAIRAGMQLRVPGWISPAQPAGATGPSALPNLPR